MQTDYCYSSWFVLQEKDSVRSVLSIGLHYVDYNKSYVSFVYTNYMCNDVRETSTKVLNNLLSITSIHYPLNYNK